jgi:hypothetical protein
MANRNRHVSSSGGGSSPLKMLVGAYLGNMTSPQEGYAGQEPGQVDFNDKDFDARQYTTDKAGKIREPYNAKNTFGRSANAEFMADQQRQTIGQSLATAGQKELLDYRLKQLPQELAIQNAADITKQQSLIPVEATKWHIQKYGVAPSTEWFSSPEYKTLANSIAADNMFAQQDKVAADRAGYGADKARNILGRSLAEEDKYNLDATSPFTRGTLRNKAEAGLLQSGIGLQDAAFANTNEATNLRNKAALATIGKPLEEQRQTDATINGLNRVRIGQNNLFDFGSNKLYTESDAEKPSFTIGADGKPVMTPGKPSQMLINGRPYKGRIPMDGSGLGFNVDVNQPAINSQPPQPMPTQRRALGVNQSLVNQPVGILSPLRRKAIADETINPVMDDYKDFYLNTPAEYWKRVLYQGY